MQHREFCVLFVLQAKHTSAVRSDTGKLFIVALQTWPVHIYTHTASRDTAQIITKNLHCIAYGEIINTHTHAHTHPYKNKMVIYNYVHTLTHWYSLPESQNLCMIITSISVLSQRWGMAPVHSHLPPASPPSITLLLRVWGNQIEGAGGGQA